MLLSTLLAMVLLATSAASAGAVLCRTYDATADWSEVSNPAGAWSYREGANLLPHVDSWQKSFGGWETAQPGWARSEDGNDRIPFFFISNGSEQFVHDFLAGDLVVHTTDNFNGVGNSDGELVWTSPFEGSVTIDGEVWMGRDIGRANDWQLLLNGTELTHGSLASGDPYSRDAPLGFSSGGVGGAAIPVETGDEIRLVVARASEAGDFVGIRMTVHCDTIVTTTTTTLPSRDCGDPVGSSHPPITATDALFVLKSAVGQFPCEKCVCDANGSDSITASDALLVLKFAVGQGVVLNCPAC